jgi:nickel-dependent lactate racemase
MLGRENLTRFRVLCHDCTDSSRLVSVGKTKCGGICRLNRAYCEADIRIATGFIEPHFFAGFSGGAKAIMPGIAGLETICHFHRAQLIAHPGVTWGETANNPLLNLAREVVSFLPPDFIVNVSLNHQKEITEIFIGNFISAHEQGCRRVAAESFIAVPWKFPVVVTTNSGYPLDMNFYQTVKGISAAAGIVEEGGSIIIASECSNGIPAGSPFEKLLMQPHSPEELLEKIMLNHETACDQWQVQVLLQIILKCRVFLYSTLDRHLEHRTRIVFIDDIEKALESERISRGIDPLPVAVMPLGPLTIPFV